MVKKLTGISLIQRAINNAEELGADKSEIHLSADSKEICLIAEQNGVNCYWERRLTWSETDFTHKFNRYLQQVTQQSEYVLLLSPYTPLLSVELINNAKQALVDSNKDLLKPVKQIKRHLYDDNGQSTFLALFGSENETHIIESKAFVLLRSNLLINKSKHKTSILSWQVERPGNSLLENCLQNETQALPELKSDELILLASLEHRISLAELLVQQGLKKNQHWVLFS